MTQENSRDFCDKNNIVLIEDCAHVIHPSVSNIWVGDYLFFSAQTFSCKKWSCFVQ